MFASSSNLLTQFCGRFKLPNCELVFSPTSPNVAPVVVVGTGLGVTVDEPPVGTELEPVGTDVLGAEPVGIDEAVPVEVVALVEPVFTGVGPVEGVLAVEFVLAEPVPAVALVFEEFALVVGAVLAVEFAPVEAVALLVDGFAFVVEPVFAGVVFVELAPVEGVVFAVVLSLLAIV